ncbi:hypothetical protein GJAV_G00221740, partial [Gymnothorax javanicus]
MKCPGCQHVAVEGNAKFCSECGLKLLQNSDQPPQKPSVPAEIGKDGSTSEVAEGTASHGTQSTNASAKRHKEETNRNPKKKKKRKRKKKTSKENKGPASSESDQLNSDLSDMSLVYIKRKREPCSDSDSSISDMDETPDSLNDQGKTSEEPCSLKDTGACQTQLSASIGPLMQQSHPEESLPVVEPLTDGTLQTAQPSSNEALAASCHAEGEPDCLQGEVRLQTDGLTNKGRKDAQDTQHTSASQDASVDQNANLTKQTEPIAQQPKQSSETKPDLRGDQNQNRNVGQQKKQEKNKSKKTKATKENKEAEPSECDQMTSDPSDVSLVDTKGKNGQVREASSSIESAVSDMDGAPHSLPEEGKTLDKPCTGSSLDETGASPAQPLVPVGPAMQENRPGESQPAQSSDDAPRAEQPSCKETVTTSSPPSSQPDCDPANISDGVKQPPDGKKNKRQKNAQNTQSASATQDVSVDQRANVDRNANVTKQTEQQTQPPQQSSETKLVPRGDQNMVFGPQKQPEKNKSKKTKATKGDNEAEPSECDQMTSDPSDVSLVDTKEKNGQVGEASSSIESAISDMDGAPHSLPEEGKTLDKPCTDNSLDETGACQAQHLGPVGPAMQENRPGESQPAQSSDDASRAEQPSCNETVTTSSPPSSQPDCDAANISDGVKQQTGSKKNKRQKNAQNTQSASATQNVTVDQRANMDQDANMTKRSEQITQPPQQSSETKAVPRGNQNMVFGSQKKPESQQASSRMSSSVDPVMSVEPEQMQQSSSPKEEASMNRDSLGEETSSETKDQNVQPPKGMPEANQQIPVNNRLTIYFHAVLSKDFKFNPDQDKIFLRAGDRIGSWEHNICELNVSRSLGDHGFLVEGNLMTTKNRAVSVSIPYKYIIYKAKKGMYEYIYKLDKLDSKQTTNRCLFVTEHLLNEEGEWHQYDDIICMEPSKGFLSSLLPGGRSDQRKNVIQGREIAGRIMLGTIFDLLSSLNEINLKNFLIQLEQFHRVYSNPYVFEEKEKKWASLDYGKEQVNYLLKAFLLENVTPQLNKDYSGSEAFIRDPLKAAVIVLYIWKKYNMKLDHGELSRLCMALCLPKLSKDEFMMYWKDFSASFSQMKGLSEMVREFVDVVKTKTMPHWILAVPLLHLLKGLAAPFKYVSSTISPTNNLPWAGLWGLSGAASMSSQDRRAIINMMEKNRHLFEVDTLLARSCLWLMTVEELVECSSIAQAGLLDLLQAFYLRTPAEVTYSCSHVSEVLIHIQKNLVEQHYSFQGEDYGLACLTTAVKLLEKICKGVKSAGHGQEYAKVAVTCANMVASVSNFFLSCEPQEKTEDRVAKMQTKDQRLLGQAMGIMRNWVSQTLRSKLTSGFYNVSYASEIETWNNIISLNFKSEEFTKEWRHLFTTDFEGKFEKESPMDQIQVYCSSIDGIVGSYPHIAFSIEKCALQAVGSICQAKAETKLL